MSSRPDLTGWIPIALHEVDEGAEVDWCFLGSTRLREPFFQDSIEDAMRRPFHRVFRHRTSLATMERWAETLPAPEPVGFLFHMSRCGSTMVSRSLAALERTVVLAEPGPVDALLRTTHLDPDRKLRALRALVACLGAPRGAGGDLLLIKFDAWSLLWFPVIRRAFPGTPWMMLLREPQAVLASLVREPGLHTIPGYLDLGVAPTDAGGGYLPQVEFVARVLARILEVAAREHQRDPARVLDYGELPEALWGAIPAHFRLSWSPEEVAILKQAAGRDAKQPGVPFDLASRGSSAASPEIREACDRWLAPAYHRLVGLAAPEVHSQEPP